jgi:flagellar hook-associated protein 2
VTVESKLLALRATLRGLRTPGDILVKTARSSDESVLSVAAGAGAADGETTINIGQIATASRATAARVFSATDGVASGRGTFEFSVGGREVQVIELSSSTTLGQLIRAINTSGAGVTAVAIDPGTEESPNYRLEIVANATGSASTITVINDDTNLDISVSPGTDARFEVTGSLDTIERASNLVTDVISGLTMILKESGSSAQVTVANDSEAIQAKVQMFVDAFNDLIEFVAADRSIVRRGTGTSSFGALATGPMVRDVLDRLQKDVRTWIADSGRDLVLSLAGIGIATRPDGGLVFDTARFQSALALDPRSLCKVLGGVDNGSGVGELLHDSLTEFFRACGLLEPAPEQADKGTREDDDPDGNGARVLGATPANLVTTLRALENSLDTIRSQGDLLLEHLGSRREASPGKQS